MSKIYLASSWNNNKQPLAVKKLRDIGHSVYDFRNPNGRKDRSVWEDIGYTNIQVKRMNKNVFKEALRKKQTKDRFQDHHKAMLEADICILLLPCGKSAHIEAGYMAGNGKRVFVMDLQNTMTQAELMYMTFDGYFYEWEELFKAIAI